MKARLALLLLLAGFASGAPVPPAKPDADRYGDRLPEGAVARLGTLRLRHTGRVQDLAFTPDDKAVVSCGHDSFLRYWDVASGKETRAVDVGRSGGSFLSTAESKFVISTGNKDELRLIDLETGRPIRDLPAQLLAAVSTDGKVLATAFYPVRRDDAFWRYRVWEIETGTELGQWTGRGVARMALTPDGKIAASAGTDGSVYVWETQGGRLRFELAKPKSGHIHQTPAFSPDGKTLACVNQEGLRLWDVESGKELAIPRDAAGKNGAGVQAAYLPGVQAAFLADGRLLTASDSEVVVWDLAAGKATHRIRGLLHSLGRDGRTAVMDVAGTWGVHDVVTGRTIAEVPTNLAVLSHDRKLLAWADGSLVRLRDLSTGKERFPPDAPQGTPAQAAVSPDGKTVAILTYEPTALRLWDVATQKVVREIRLREQMWQGGIAFSPDSRLAVLERNVIRLFDPRSGEEVRSVNTGELPLRGILFSPDGRSIGTATVRRYGESHFETRTMEAFVWDLTTGKLTRQTGIEKLGFLGVGFRRGRWLAAEQAWGHSTLRTVIWDVASGRQIAEGPERLFRLLPDARLALASRENGGLVLWEVATGGPRCEHADVKGWHTPVESPDGRLVAAGQEDGTVCLWHLGTGRKVLELSGHRGRATALQFSPDGRFLISGGIDTTVLVWDVSRLRRREGLPDRPKPAELPALWDDLRREPNRAHTAGWSLVAADGDAVQLLDERLRPLRGWPALLRCLLEFLASRGWAPVVGLPEAVREARAIEVLEHIGTDEARKVLEKLAAGSKWAPLTHDAHDALERLRRRPGRP